MSKAAKMLSMARASIILDHPFFASLLLPMPLEVDELRPTLATDGERIVYNPEFIEEQSAGGVVFAMAHETLHCVFDHCGRRENRCPENWDLACDYIVNNILVEEKVGEFIEGCLYDPALVKRGGGTAEGVYKLLPPVNSKNKKKRGQAGGALDTLFDAGSEMGTKKPDAATKAQKSADMKVRVIQARNAAKMQGNLSAGLERLVKEIIKPVVAWEDVMMRFMSERAKTEYSYARPKRRYIDEDIMLPSLVGVKMGELIFATDCSGSVNSKLLGRFAGQINIVKHDLQPSKITVIYFDSKVLTPVQTFEAEDEVVLKPVGGGGTAFSPVFKYINALPEPPVAVIFLTDLECDDFGPAPDYPVLWCVLDKFKGRKLHAPFGEIVEVARDE